MIIFLVQSSLVQPECLSDDLSLKDLGLLVVRFHKHAVGFNTSY